MRAINSFIVSKTDLNYGEVIQSARDIGLRYPAPHYLIFMVDGDAKVIKLRPLSERCGTVRESSLNRGGVGILVEGGLTNEISKQVARIIKATIDDLGIEKYRIVSDEWSRDNFVDVSQLQAMINSTPSIFPKLT